MEFVIEAVITVLAEFVGELIASVGRVFERRRARRVLGIRKSGTSTGGGNASLLIQAADVDPLVGHEVRRRR